MKIAFDDLLKTFNKPSGKSSYFISIEGIEGAGKTAQIHLMQTYLENKGLKVIILREPGGTKFGERLRDSILESQSSLNPLAEAYLFASARAQLIEEIILKKLNDEKTVIICDRYIDSSIVYQGIAGALGIEKVLQIHSLSPLNLFPHLTLYLKISVSTSIERMRKRNNEKDYFESRENAFFEDLINGYDDVAQLFPNRIKTIDGENSQQTVFALIQAQLDQLLGDKC